MILSQTVFRVFIVLGLFKHCSSFYKVGTNLRKLQRERIQALMLDYCEESSRKIIDIHHIRFTYSVSHHYEMGYVMGEIIERYRKMVGHLKRMTSFIADVLYAHLKRIELIQVLYFEVYHLVHMMHEIPRKYGFRETSGKVIAEVPFDVQISEQAKAKIERDRQERHKAKKKKTRELKKMRELILKGKVDSTTAERPKNKWWPIDYGWEIDYYW